MERLSNEEKIKINTEKLMEYPLESYGRFWAHEVCFACGHNLKEDKEHQPWQGMTYCPKCNRSFLE